MDLHKQSVKNLLETQFQHLDQIEEKITKENKILKALNMKMNK